MATWTNANRPSTSFSNQTRSVTTFTNQPVTLEGKVTATAGMYYGFGAFTYAGGEILVAGTLPAWTNQTRN